MVPPHSSAPTSLSAGRLFRAWQPFDIQMISTNSELDPVETFFFFFLFFSGRRCGLGIESKAEIEDGSDGEGRFDGGSERKKNLK